MNNSITPAANGSQAADKAAERIVRHFQAKGFTHITEALLIQIHHIGADRTVIEEAFEAAQEQDKAPPVAQYFEIRPCGHYAESRNFDEAKSALKSDLTTTLINDIPKVFFDAAPVVIDDPLASGTKYDVMMKLRDNLNGYAVVVLLNDPSASFIDYVGSYPGSDWQKIMGEFEFATQSLGDVLELN